MPTRKEEWKEKVYKPGLARFPERKPQFKTSSDIPVDVVYTPDDVADNDYTRDLGMPGDYPFTRGVQPTMYRGRLWTMRQYAGFASPEESNRRYRYLLDQGQTGLSIAFDLPTQTGYDGDNPMAQGEIGKSGVPIYSLADMEVVLDKIPLDKVSTSMTINSTASILLSYYIAVAKKQGVDPKNLNGTVQNDILKEYIARGTQIYPPRPSMRLVTDLFAFCKEATPKWNTISISGYHMREAGCTAAQEVGFTLANAVAYVQAAIDAGMQVDDFGPQLSFFFVAQNNFLEEVAKFRAARRLWAKIMKERFGSKNPRSQMLRFHTQTAGVTLTAQQIDNNVVRSTIQTLAAILGGTQSMHTNSRDEALALPTEEAVKLSLRTQQVIAYESGVTDTVDPLAGSYYIESLTSSIEAAAMKYIQEIDRRGGAVAAIEQGYQQMQIQEAAYTFQKEVESKEKVIVGVNEFVEEENIKVETLKIDRESARRQLARLAQVRQTRDSEKAATALKHLEVTAKGKGNTMPAILEAAEAYCTTGEICDVLRKVFGTQEEITAF